MSSLLALDLGTTRLKGARWASGAHPARARPLEVHAVDAPAPLGAGLVREVDPQALRAAAQTLLAQLAQIGPVRGERLGIACQRSSFLLFDVDGRPATPLVSWQDRRAVEACAQRTALAPLLFQRAGLPLSPHYVGPKLAALFAARPSLADAAHAGRLRLGTLETWLAYLWTGGVHETDLSMAARTALCDLTRGTWSDELCAGFGVPPALLPAIVDSAGRARPGPAGRVLAATVADQSASLLAALGEDERSVLVNLGTGCFVLRPAARFEPRRGYLSAVVARRAGRSTFALEGTINAGGATLDALSSGPTAWREHDPSPDAFCVPDENGWGAPHWRAERSACWSPGARALAPAARRRVAHEGLLFRVREILDDLVPEPDAHGVRLVLAGGLARDPFSAAALAALWPGAWSTTDDPESTLRGAALLAAEAKGDAPRASTPAQSGAAVAAIPWLREKYARWKAWAAVERAHAPSDSP